MLGGTRARTVSDGDWKLHARSEESYMPVDLKWIMLKTSAAVFNQSHRGVGCCVVFMDCPFVNLPL